MRSACYVATIAILFGAVGCARPGTQTPAPAHDKNVVAEAAATAAPKTSDHSRQATGSGGFVLLNSPAQIGQSYCLRPQKTGSKLVNGVAIREANSFDSWLNTRGASGEIGVVQLDDSYAPNTSCQAHTDWIKAKDRIEITPASGGTFGYTFTHLRRKADPKCANNPGHDDVTTKDCYEPISKNLTQIPMVIGQKDGHVLYLKAELRDPANMKEDRDYFVMLADDLRGGYAAGTSAPFIPNSSQIEKYYWVEVFPKLEAEKDCDNERPSHEDANNYLDNLEPYSPNCVIPAGNQGTTSGGGGHPPDWP